MPPNNRSSGRWMSMHKKVIIQAKKKTHLEKYDHYGLHETDFVFKCLLAGKTHDYRMLKEEFPPSTNWFKNFSIRLDLGHLGFEKDYVCKSVYLPAKAKKTVPLTTIQKASNRELSSQRIGIEHSISGLKRYRIWSDRLRVHDIEGHDSTLEVCAGLWNFYLSN